MSSQRKRRATAPCNDRETVYKTMAELSFVEVNKMNFDLLDWMEKTVLVYEPNLTKSQMWNDMTPEKFLELLTFENGLWLERLAIRLGSSELGSKQNRSSYEVFYEFALNKAKLAEGCIFLEDELLPESHKYEDYKSVFYTLYKLANQARQKFGVPSLVETRGMSWTELSAINWDNREKCYERKQLYQTIAKWSFGEVDKKNQQIMEWLNRNKAIQEQIGISAKDFLAHISSDDGKRLLSKLSNPNEEFDADKFYDNFYAFAKDQLPDECIFWESELYGASYDDYKSVFCTLYMLMNWEKSNHSTAIVDPAMGQSSSSKSGFLIIVHSLTGKNIFIGNCFPAQTIKQFKVELAKREGIPVDQQRLIFAGKQLEGNYTLAEFGVRNGSTVHLILRLSGC